MYKELRLEIKIYHILFNPIWKLSVDKLTKSQKYISALCFKDIWVWNLVFGARGRTKAAGVLEEGPEEDNVSLKGRK